MKKYIEINNKLVLTLGMGTWNMGENKNTREEEIKTIRRGIDLGLNLIDTAEMYGEGLSEELIGEAISGYDREKLFIVSKFYPSNSSIERLERSLSNSLKRLGVDYLDMYLLHWRDGYSLEKTVENLNYLVTTGKIKSWGVSNFNTEDMKELFSIYGGEKCKVNQVLYNLTSRGIEYDLLDYMKEKNVILMAYCPICHNDSYRKVVSSSKIIKDMCTKYNTDIFGILIDFVLKQNNTLCIPKTSKLLHLESNIKALDLEISKEDFMIIEQEFKAPNKKVPLDVL